MACVDQERPRTYYSGRSANATLWTCVRGDATASLCASTVVLTVFLDLLDESCVDLVRDRKGHRRSPLAKEQKLARVNHSQRLALKEEALTVLFCLVDDAYALLNPRALCYQSLRRKSWLSCGSRW